MSTNTLSETSLNGRQANWSLVATILCVFVAWGAINLAFFDGFRGSDDFHHMRFAMFWDRLPVDHWETRLPFNAMLRLSFLTFGFGQVSGSLPNLLGSMLVLASGMHLAWRFSQSKGMVLLTGLLLACLPVNLGWAPNAKPLATGLATAGFAVLLSGSGVRSVIAAGLLFAFGIWCHVSLLFFVGIVIAVATVMKLRPWQHCALALGIAGAAYAAGEFGTFWIWAGDPFYGFRIVSSVALGIMAHDPDFVSRTGGTVCSWRFVWTPIRDLLASQGLGAVGLAAVGGAIVRWRSLDRFARSMVWIALLTWAWMSYGTTTPTRYLPFPMTVN
jgi:hypothetical protein